MGGGGLEPFILDVCLRVYWVLYPHTPIVPDGLTHPQERWGEGGRGRGLERERGGGGNLDKGIIEGYREGAIQRK